ncbi:CaiF/GrlA family transcriptional regulator [Salmonella enterica]|nr:CaiF/GrlA family transcriptional regulator [Salmonella enterica]
MDNTQQTYAREFPCSRKKTIQSNHDTFVIPPSLQQYADEPLYILVALWCREQNDWVSRMAISGAFGITDRRASFQVSYLSRNKKRVNCEVRAVRTDNSQRFYHEIRVKDVVLTRDAEKTVSVRSKKGAVKRSKVGNATPELRNMFNSLIGSRRLCDN